MIKVLILEDDFIWQMKLESFLKEYEDYKILRISGQIDESIELLNYLTPDLIIADIYLDNRNVCDYLNKKFESTPTLFISNTQEEVILNKTHSFQMSTYLVKPFNKFAFISTLNYLAESFIKKNSKFLITKTNNKTPKKIFFNEIDYIIAEGNYCIIFLNNGKKIAKKISLTKFLSLLDTRFRQINKNSVVNLNAISKLDYLNEKVYIQNQNFPIGRVYKKILEEVILESDYLHSITK